MPHSKDAVEILQSIRLTARDREILVSYEPVVEGIAKLLGRNCEVILHSFEDPGHSVMKIENAHITGRKIGSPITDLGLNALTQSFESKQDVIGSYFTKTDSGKVFKSITVLIRNPKGGPIGMLCVNLDISAPFMEFVGDYIPASGERDQTREHFPTEIPDLVHRSLEDVMMGINTKTGISAAEKNRLIIMELFQRGIFEIKGAIDSVAGEMGVSKYTIYHHLREMKPKTTGGTNP
jgi:predicted transcriptional regulator YheO